MDSLTRNSLYLSIEKGAHLLGGMVLLVGVARILGEQGLAQYAFVISFTAIFIPILDLGLNTRAIKLVGSGHPEGFSAVSDAVEFKFTLAGPILLAMLLGSVHVGNSSNYLAVLLVGSSTIAMSAGDAINSLFKGLSRSSLSALLVGSLNGALLVLGIGTMLLGGGIVGVAGCYLLCRACYLGAGLAIARSMGLAISLRTRPKIQMSALLEGIRHLPSVYFVGFLFHITYIVLSLNMNEAESSYVAIAYRISAALFILFSSSFEAVLPAISRVFHKGTDIRLTLVRGFTTLLVFSLLGVGLVQMLAYPAISLVFGKDYAPAVEAVRLVSWTIPPLVLCGLAHTAFLAMDEEDRGSLWMLAMVLVCVAGTALAVKLSGPPVAVMVPIAVAWLFAGAFWTTLLRIIRQCHSPVQEGSGDSI